MRLGPLEVVRAFRLREGTLDLDSMRVSRRDPARVGLDPNKKLDGRFSIRQVKGDRKLVGHVVVHSASISANSASARGSITRWPRRILGGSGGRPIRLPDDLVLQAKG